MTEERPGSIERRTESLTRPSRLELGNLRQEMDRLFDRFLDGWGGSLQGLSAWGGRWSPRADLSETAEAYILRAELPEMESKDVDVQLENNVLTIRGERRQEKREGENDLATERFYGTFTRSFVLPGEVNAERVAAAYKNGVLTVTVPKSEDSRKRVRKIPISS